MHFNHLLQAFNIRTVNIIPNNPSYAKANPLIHNQKENKKMEKPRDKSQTSSIIQHNMWCEYKIPPKQNNEFIDSDNQQKARS